MLLVGIISFVAGAIISPALLLMAMSHEVPEAYTLLDDYVNGL